MVLERRYCITLSTVNDCLSVVERETTPFNTTALEEVVMELGCTQAARKIGKYNEFFRNDELCCNPSRSLSHSVTVETLSITMDCPPNTPNAMIHNFLSLIFGNLFGDVVRWHYTSDECIVCYFPPIYSTLLISKILEKFSLCKEKQVKKITVGYCTVYNEIFYDEV